MGLGDIIGGIGSLIGGIGGSHAQQQANANAAAAAQAQQKINQQAINAAQGMMGGYQQNYAPSMAPLGADYLQIAQGPGSQAASLSNTLINMGMDPNAVAAITGINANQLVGGATNYLSNVGGTPLAQAAPGLQSFFAGEQAQGIDPRFALNAQNQLQQQAAQQQSDILSRARPGQNLAGQEQDITNSLLQASANLGGNLAGQSQQFAQQGAQGLQGLAQMLGSERAANLQNAASIGSNYNQQQLQNAAGSQGTAMSALQALLPFLYQGLGMQESGINTMTGIGSQYGNLATGAANTAANYGNPWATAMQNIGNTVGSGGFGTNIFGGGGGGVGQAQTPGSMKDTGKLFDTGAPTGLAGTNVMSGMPFSGIG